MTKHQSWFQENGNEFSGQLFLDEPLSKYTYYRIGGPASVLAVPKSQEDLAWIARGIRETGIPLFILGQGSNLLVADEGFQGLIVRANRLNLEIKVLEPQSESESLRVRTGASVAISSFLRRASQEGWGGLEFLTGIPGSIGGAVVMNAGTHLGETQGALQRVEAYRLLGEGEATQAFEGKDLTFQYRKNLFLPSSSLVLAAEWAIRKESPEEVKNLIDRTLARRKSTQPIDFPSCGSVFKNPKAFGMSAWQVIDKLGLRGHRIGEAQFAEKHSNFIINLGKARAADVRALIDLAKNRAQKELGILLEEEVIFLGF